MPSFPADTNLSLGYFQGVRPTPTHPPWRRGPSLADVAGPPVLASVVAEIYGPPNAEYEQLIAYGKELKKVFAGTAGLVSPDDFSIAPEPRFQFVLDRRKAALNGVTAAEAAQTLAIVLGGQAAGTVHIASERNPLRIELR